MSALPAVSADSHMTEPGDLWVERLDKRFRAEAPRVVKNETTGRYVFVGPGIHPLAVAGAFAAGKKGSELREHMARGYEAARPSGWDPVERLKDQDLDSIRAEVLYATLGLALFSLEDTALQLACVRVYNDWLAEFCAHSPRRLIGIGLISLADVSEAVREVERCVRRGLRGILILATQPRETPYSSATYDSLWQAVSEAGMPVSLHKPLVSGMPLTPAAPTMADLQIGVIHVVEQCLTRMIYGGVLERFPRLKLVSAENDVGWIPNWIHRLDHVNHLLGAAEPLSMNPSDYARRQIWATFQDDPLGPATYKFFGENNYMWASDFPHADSTFPNSQDVIRQNFEGVPEEVARKIVFDNAVRLYRIDLN